MGKDGVVGLRFIHLIIRLELTPTAASKVDGWPIRSAPFFSGNTNCFLWFDIFFSPSFALKMSFSTLVSDLTFKDSAHSTETASQASRAKSYTSTAATSVSISGDISSQLHGGYSHPLARAWQAERQLTKVCCLMLH